jgi:lipopolysaccharide biosynthesis protein
LVSNLHKGIISAALKIYDYEHAISLMDQMPYCKAIIPSVFVGWDNVARRGAQGIVIDGASPDKFTSQLVRAISRAVEIGSGNRLVFVNAWNEWAEGNHLEPDQKFGHGYLQALKQALSMVQEKFINDSSF